MPDTASKAREMLAEALLEAGMPICAKSVLKPDPDALAIKPSAALCAIEAAIRATVEEAARVAVACHGSYHEPTDWDYGAQDACIKIERAIRALTRIDRMESGDVG